jgi:hypothetical protein
MATANRDSHQIHADLEEVEGYQRPPREHEQRADGGQPSSGADDPVDLSLLEAQQERRHKPEMSETKPEAAAAPKSTVSGKDELSDPANTRATPPGERM